VLCGKLFYCKQFGIADSSLITDYSLLICLITRSTLFQNKKSPALLNRAL
jgi:hypothetical protein